MEYSRYPGHNVMRRFQRSEETDLGRGATVNRLPLVLPSPWSTICEGRVRDLEGSCDSRARWCWVQNGALPFSELYDLVIYLSSRPVWWWTVGKFTKSIKIIKSGKHCPSKKSNWSDGLHTGQVHVCNRPKPTLHTLSQCAFYAVQGCFESPCRLALAI